jgi:hypothetical protein
MSDEKKDRALSRKRMLARKKERKKKNGAKIDNFFSRCSTW